MGSKQTGTYDPKHKFTGKELDPSTGLYFYGARYYDHEIGRFISADTIVQSPYDPQSLNRYAYCRNNPINYTDPTGNFWFIPLLFTIAKAALVGVAVGAALGAALGGISAVINGASIGQGIVMGFVTGAVSGAAAGAGGALCSIGIGIIAPSALNSVGIQLAIGAFSGAFGGLAGAGCSGASLAQGVFWGAITGGVATGVGVSPVGQAIGKAIGGTSVGKLFNKAGNWVGESYSEFIKEVHGGSATAALNTNKSGIISENQSLSAKGKNYVDLGQIEVTPNDIGSSAAFPSDRGFVVPSSRVVLESGTLLDRYGASTGEFLSPAGTAFSARGLPGSSIAKSLHTYQVVKPFEVYGGSAKPAYGQQGLGMQYDLGKGRNVQGLIDQGYLREIQ